MVRTEDTPTILVVDDNINGLHTLAILLELEGYRVAMASTGREALDIARQILPRLIILDVAMPGMTGIALATELRKIRELDGTRLVAYSGYVSAKIQQECIDAGCDLFLEKPVAPEKLQLIVHKFLNAGKPSVLFVDDNEFKRLVCCTALRSDGITVVEANSGQQALDVIEAADPGLVLADAHLSDMDGYELCERTKKLKDVPVVLVSVSPMDMEKAASCHISGYIRNYDDPDALIRHVRGAMK